ncbi:DNA replication licensing factor CDC47 [Didymella exigua CBS 183.55]|uniref:DNA replication licensing factor MCM7 n=1 Tax=Didymella exigua CBS 183.55 TaxID=1150837 RepID=A0A6A5RP54_9PLEO|nr:DNA replication licensing factor CDC47 [Didymella exigua CBS 183.55]KAF1929552.1 DNA replication licensing factor CDC47 [Didymella exigua CBS 183.55]
MALLTEKALVNYEEQEAAFVDFLKHFKSSSTAAEEQLERLTLGGNANDDECDMADDSDGPAPSQRARRSKSKYMDMLQDVANRVRSDILIELNDVDAVRRPYERATVDDETNYRLVESIERNAHHYLEILSRAVDKCLPPPTREINFKDNVLDVIMTQRSKRNERIQELQGVEDSAQAEPESIFPAALTRRYTLNLAPRTASASSSQRPAKALAVRNVKGEHLGQLITVRGIATRVSDVKPAVLVNAYSCDRCGSEVFQPVSTKQFTPLVECPSVDCKNNKTKGQLFLSTRASKFLPFQEVKIQEMADQVPVGHIPRQLTIHCHGALVRSVNPGDVVDVAGIFLPTPYTGFKAMRAGLLTDTYLEAQQVVQHKKAYDDMVLAQPTLKRMKELERSGQLYEYLSRSIAPEIFGHVDVKKALLLQLIGGVTKEVKDGMRIRGDINVCLMGDPGVAKSQLLKYITKVAPRGVYTTGRGSSGVGLTAAVMRDPVTDEMVLEGGALVLADNGMCCIDEFDKMDDSDRTAIHEVMEQQTISISKAGITTTLNARTSILAAANPLYGRYNPRISPVENINLPAALLSRFDVLFLILDTPSRDSDEELARHVAYVHMHNAHPEAAGGVVFSPAEVRQWVARARSYRPTVPKPVSDYMVGAYVRMRQQQKRDEGSKKAFTHTSPRTLLGILRLAQALARLRFADEVISEDVDEALRLTEVSKASLYVDENRRDDRTPSSNIYHLIKSMEASGAAALGDGTRGELDLRRVRERVLAKGFTADQFEQAVDEYSMLDVWQTAGEGTRLVFIEAGDEDMDADNDF